MSYNGLGTFNVDTAGQPVVTGTVISSTVFNAFSADVANGLSNAVTRDGQSPATADIPMGGHRMTNMSNGVLSSDSATLAQITAAVATYTPSGAGAVATTVQAQLRAIQSWVLNVKDAPYLCVGDGITDNTSKFADIRTFAATLSAAGNAVEIQIPAGRYVYSASPNWAINRLTLRALGEVWFINTGTGQSFLLDGGATGPGVYGMKVVGNLLVHGPSGSSNGAYIRSVHTSELDINVRGAGTAFAGLYMEWCVSNTIRYSCNANEGGFSSAMNKGMFLTSRASDSAQTSYNTFINPQCSGMSVGAYMDGSLGNTFIGGAMQACTTYGIDLTVNAYNNKFFGTDLEVNTTADIRCDGRENNFFSVDSFTLAKFTANALNNRLIGGAYQNITIDASATRTTLSNLAYNRFGAGVITDNGTQTRYRDIINKGTATIENTPRARTALTVGASPYTYTNNTGNEESVMVYGGTISQLVLSRFSGDALGITAGQFTLSPGDSIIVTYSVLPVMVKWSR
jgi:hypothetical protein